MSFYFADYFLLKFCQNIPLDADVGRFILHFSKLATVVWQVEPRTSHLAQTLVASFFTSANWLRWFDKLSDADDKWSTAFCKSAPLRWRYCEAMLTSERTLDIIKIRRTNWYRSRLFLRRAASSCSSLFALSSMIWGKCFHHVRIALFHSHCRGETTGLSFLRLISDSPVIDERMSHLLILWPNKMYNSSRVERNDDVCLTPQTASLTTKFRLCAAQWTYVAFDCSARIRFRTPV